MAITDLTNTTWVVPAGWSATQKLVFFVSGELSIGDTDYSLPSKTALTINTSRISFAHGSWDDNINISPSQSFTITFETVSAQIGYTVEQLISWLEANGELQGGDAPTDAVTIEYNGAVIASLKAGQTATLPCKDALMHTDVVVSVPDGLGGSVEEWDGSYTVSGGTISFTIDGTSYEAEEGMTWYEWANSDYNTAGAWCYRENANVTFPSASPNKMVQMNGVDVVGTDIIVADTAYTTRAMSGAD